MIKVGRNNSTKFQGGIDMLLQKRSVICAIFTVVCLAALVLCSFSASAALPQLGELAPDFNLKKADGSGNIRLSDLRGRPVLIMFWGPNCGYCKQMFPSMIANYPGWVKKYNVEILSIGYSPYPSLVNKVVDQYKLNFPVLLIDGPTEGRYGVRVVPAFYLVDADGYIRYTKIGSGESTVNLENRIKAIVK
jgi:thiol-disulfide isomerase/thioredoxin